MPGDLAKLVEMQRRLREVSKPSSTSRMMAVIAEEAMTQVRLGFRESRDPYGVPWKPLTLRVGGKPLDDTGAHLKNRIVVIPSGASSFRIGTNFVGAKVHQYGANIKPKNGQFLRFNGYNARGRRDGKNVVFARSVTIPARPYLPTKEGGIGPIWGPALRAAARRAMSRILQK